MGDLSSCDASGDARRAYVSGKPLPDPAAPHAPPAAGSLGSRFWALVAEDSDSGDEGCAGSEQSAGESQGGSPRSSPTQRTLGDFLGPEWKVVAPAGRQRGGKRASFAPGGRCAGFSARVASSSDLPPSVEPSACDFPPLPAPAVSGACPPVPGREFLVGSLSIPVLASPEPVAAQVAAAPELGSEVLGFPMCGDVDVGRPLVEAVGVVPAGQSLRLQGDTASDSSGPPLVQFQPITAPAQPMLPSALLKWAWRPVGTLDPALLIPTPFSDLVRANLLHLTVLAPQISRSALLLAMDRSRREGRDG
jgi:hypothetical protein